MGQKKRSYQRIFDYNKQLSQNHIKISKMNIQNPNTDKKAMNYDLKSQLLSKA